MISSVLPSPPSNPPAIPTLPSPHCPSSSVADNTINLLLDSEDLWGIQDFHSELQQVDSLFQKCETIKLRRQKVISTVGSIISSSMILVSYQKYRERKLTQQMVTMIDSLLPKIIYVEESIRLWFEAIVMKKWSLRHEILKYFQDMDQQLTRLSCDRKENSHRLSDCEELIKFMKRFIKERTDELNFIEVLLSSPLPSFDCPHHLSYLLQSQMVSMLKDFELWRLSRSNHSNEEIETTQSLSPPPPDRWETPPSGTLPLLLLSSSPRR
jgi:hypothetical protein